MRKFKINSGVNITPNRFDNPVDEEFLNDVSSIITLEDGSSLDLNRARVLYNPHTHRLQITDAESDPKDYVQLATLTITQDKPEVTDDEPLEEPSEEGTEEEETLGDGAGEEVNRDDGAVDEEMPVDDEDSGNFFQ